MLKNFHILYKTTNKVSNKIYVGIHSTDNFFDGYLGSGTLIKKAIKEYGRSNFSREVIDTFSSRDLLIEAETRYVTQEFIDSDSNYNVCIGGSGAPGLTPMKGKIHTEHSKAKMSYAHADKKLSITHKANIKQSMSKLLYKTPKGHFLNSRDAGKANNCGHSTIQNRCKNKNNSDFKSEHIIIIFRG